MGVKGRSVGEPGLPPGTLVYVGRKRKKGVRISLLEYDEGSFRSRTVRDIAELKGAQDTAGVKWVDVVGIHDAEVVGRIGDLYGIHPLALEDLMNTRQRPKLDDLGDHLFTVLKMFYLKGDRVDSEQLSLVLKGNTVISFQEREGDVFDPIRERLKENKGRIRRMGADYLLYALMDAIIDNYFVILEWLGERVEELEERLISDPQHEHLESIYSLKHDLISLRRSIWPLREVIGSLQRQDSSLFSGEMRPFVGDLYDHSIQVIESVESYRDTLSGLTDIYMSAMSNRMNEVMKVLTIIATIFIPLTFIAGIYGMNFEYMPELGWYVGYPLVLIVMVAVVVSMLFYFKRKRWI